MNLYKVNITIVVVVYADDPAQAEQVALKNGIHEKAFGITDPAVKIVTVDDLPFGWDTGSLPYGRADDVSIGEIIGVTKFAAPAMTA